jgi:hypothetical protein
MILKQEITALANNLKLLPTTVEKDYVLSWVLSEFQKILNCRNGFSKVAHA